MRMNLATLSQLMTLFRQQGYDGASLTEIAAATGLGKSSLYHHFPGGKVEMATSVLALLDRSLQPTLEALADDRPPQKKLNALLSVLDDFYDGGRTACLLERLTASVDRALFATPLKAGFTTITHAFATLAHQAGHTRARASHRAEDAIVTLQGALVVAAGTEDTGVFRRALARIRDTLLAPAQR